MSSVKSFKRGRKEIEKEKKEILKRLQKIKRSHEIIVRHMNDIVQEATNAGTQLINESSKSKFWLKLGPLSSIIAQTYGCLVNITSHIPVEDDEESDSSSATSQGSLDSIMSIESVRSSMMSVAGLNASCGASTSNASCQTPIDPKGAGDAKALKKTSRTSLNQSQSQTCTLPDNDITAEESETLDGDDDFKASEDTVGCEGNGSSTVREKHRSLSTNAEKSNEVEEEPKHQPVMEVDPVQSVDSTPRAVCSADGVYRLIPKRGEKALVSYETESLASYEKDDEEEEEELEEVTETVPSDSKQENQSAISSYSSSNEPFSSNASAASLSPVTVFPPQCVIGSKNEVIVLDVQSPSDFWVQFLGQQDSSVRLDYLMSLHCNSPNADKPGKDLAVGLHCCAWDDSEELWFRAVVTRISYNWEDETPNSSVTVKNVEVRYLDVGTLSTVTPDKLRTMNKECATYPATAMRCKLARIVPYSGLEWSSDTNATFHNWVHVNVFQMTIVDFATDGVAVVELDEGTKANMMNVGNRLVEKKLAKYMHDNGKPNARCQASNKMLHFTRLERDDSVSGEEGSVTISADSYHTAAQPADREKNALYNMHSIMEPILQEMDENSDNRFTWTATIEEAPIPKTSEFCLIPTHANSPTAFYGVDKDRFAHYMWLLEEMAQVRIEYENRVTCPVQMNVKVDSFWAVKSTLDSKWYRAQVLDIKKPVRARRRSDAKLQETTFLVLYVDFGDSEWLTINEFRPLRESHTSIPAFALRCALARTFPPLGKKITTVNLYEDWDWSIAAVEEFKNLVSDSAYLDAKIVPQICERSESMNAPIPLELYFAEKRNSPSVNELFLESGFATEHITRRSTADDVYSENETFESFEDYNPLMEDYYSDQNRYAVDRSDAGVAVTGYSARDDVRICRDFKRYGQCNDPYCKFEHTISEDPYITSDTLPALINLPSIIEAIETGMQLAVLITSVINPGHFFVVLPYGTADVAEISIHEGSVNNENNLSALMTSLNKHCTRNISLTNPNIMPALGEFVAGKVEGKWHRLRVLRIDDDVFEAVCVDYGDIVQVAIRDVMPLPRQFHHMPTQAVECKLWNVEPVASDNGYRWSQNANQWFDHFTAEGDHVFFLSVENKNDDILYVTMYDTERNNSINEELVALGYATRIDDTDQRVNG